MDTTKIDPIRLDFQSKRQVVVSPDDEDRFVTTEGEAAIACKQWSNREMFKEQFNAFLTEIHDWCEVRSAKVRSCFVSIGDSSLNILICTHGVDYDFEFDDAIVNLDVSLSEKFPLCIAELLQIPNQAALTKELPKEALWVYGDGGRTSQTSNT